MKFSWLSPPYCPVVVAHRGSLGNAPENTMAAFRLALKEGADAIELDVHLSKDGHPVVIHDVSLDRTTDGSGKVRNYTLRQLKKFNAASGWEHDYPFETLPALDAVLREFGHAIGINIEIKRERIPSMQLELLRKCTALVQKYKLYNSVMISSFCNETVKTIKKFDSRLIAGLLYDPLFHPLRLPAAYAKSVAAQYLIMSRTKLLKSTVAAARACSIMTGEFGVNTEKQAERSIRYGVNAIYTDRPARILSYLNRK